MAPAASKLRWGLAIGTLVAALAGLGILAGTQGDEEPAARADSPTGEVTSPTTAGDGGDEPAPPGWRRGAPGPLLHRERAAQVWTGTELVIWGGDPDGDSGAAYDPGADRWRRIAAAPIPPRCQPATAWTGQEVLVWGRTCRVAPDRSGSATAGAAYDPAADRWRVLPDAPVEAGSIITSVWVDLGDGRPGHARQWIVFHHSSPTLAFVPTSGEWRTLPAVPRPFTSVVAQRASREVLVLGTERVEHGPSAFGATYRHWTAALDLSTGRWRELPPPPLELNATAVFDGRRLIAWDQNLNAVGLDPALGSGWEKLPSLPFDFADCSPQGTGDGPLPFAEHCGQGALWLGNSTGRDSWERIPHPKSLAELPVWTGKDFL
ncbi:MAG TPA: hypothetical protein VEG38_16000, partial [Acidimicrobiia bacterium]|nr:hypothetical protein [Acidimicrobiia bacterium]